MLMRPVTATNPTMNPDGPTEGFLDEGTAHIDAQTEMKIMDTLKSLNITCIYVTHNPNLLQYADQVIQWHHGGPLEVSNVSGQTRQPAGFGRK